MTLTLPVEFYRDNLVSPAQRGLTLGAVLGAFAIAFIAGAVMVSREPRRVVAALEWLVRLLCPVLMLPFLLALIRHDFGADLEEAVLLGAFAIGLDRLMRVSLEAWAERPVPAVPEAPGRLARVGARVRAGVAGFFARPKLVLATLVGLAAAHGTLMATWAVWSHQRFATFGYDLGQYDQIFQMTLHGRPLAIPTLGWPQNWGELINGHADLGTFYMLPFYAIYPRAPTLLVMQSTALAAASIPLYLFAKNRLPTAMAFLVAVCWLMYPPLHGAQLYDVHMQPFGASWAVAAICAVDYKKWKLYWLFFVFAILCREDVSIGLTVLGTFLALSGHRVKTGIATALIAGAYFFGLRFALMQNTGFANIFKDLHAPGEAHGFGSIIKTLISNPSYTAKTLLTGEKLRYICQLLAPLAFLPLRRPALWILAAPGFILTLLSTQYLPTIQTSFQYVSNWAAYMLPASAVALSLYASTDQGRRHRLAAAIALGAAMVVANIQWGAYSPRGSVKGGFMDVPLQRPTKADYERHDVLQELVKKVPEDKALCTSDRIQAHTTWFLNNWSLKDGLWDCEYLLWSNIPGDLGSERGPPALAAGFELLETKAGLFLAKKRPPPPPAVPAVPAPAPTPAPVP